MSNRREAWQQTRVSRNINRLIVAAMLSIAVALAIILSWAWQSPQVLEVKNSPFPTRTIRDHPTAGGVIILDADYCKYQNLKGRMRISFVSSTREVLLPIVEEALSPGCRRIEVPVLIPKEIPADTYQIKFRSTYDLNPIKKGVVVEFESRQVEVDPEMPVGITPLVKDD